MTEIMGILNVTPDSFSDGGRFNNLDNALFHADKMLKSGAKIVDIGGESTRPGAADVSEQEELDRVIPVISRIHGSMDVEISVDTSKAQVMKEAIKAGATLVNDVRALQERGAAEVCAEADVRVCLMHMQGQPRTMQASPQYDDVINDVRAFFEQRIAVCTQAGIKRDNIILDPGFGFGKTLSHNCELLAKLERFLDYNLPVLVGISRKSMIGQILGDVPVEQRKDGSVAAALIAAQKGASIIRVHDVKETADALAVLAAIKGHE